MVSERGTGSSKAKFGKKQIINLKQPGVRLGRKKMLQRKAVIAKMTKTPYGRAFNLGNPN